MTMTQVGAVVCPSCKRAFPSCGPDDNWGHNWKSCEVATAARLAGFRAGRAAAAAECKRHADFLHKEAHSGGDFTFLVIKRDEASYLERRILSLEDDLSEVFVEGDEG